MIRPETSSLLRSSGLKRPSRSPGFVRNRLLNFPKRTQSAISSLIPGYKRGWKGVQKKCQDQTKKQIFCAKTFRLVRSYRNVPCVAPIGVEAQMRRSDNVANITLLLLS